MKSEKPGRPHGHLMDRLLVLAGVDPHHATEFIDRARYTCAALFMVLYYVYATAGCTFFLMIATGGGFFPGVLVGLLVAAAVVVYDRFLLSQVSVNFSDLHKNDARLLGRPKIGSYVVRFVITLFIAVVVTDPLILKMFDAEITTELGRRHTEQVSALNAAVEENRSKQLTALDEEITNDQERLDAATKAVDNARTAVTNEREGRGATGQSGPGPVYNLLSHNYTNAVTRQNEAANTLAAALSNRPANTLRINDEATRRTAENTNGPPPPAGVLDHQNALLPVLHRNLHALLLCILIYLLLMTLDLAVLFIKLAGRNSAYDISVAAAGRSRLRVALASSKADEEVDLTEIRLRAEKEKRDLCRRYGANGTGEFKGTIYTAEHIPPLMGELLSSLSPPMAAAVGGKGVQITYDGPAISGSWEKTFYFVPQEGNTFEDVRDRARAILASIATSRTATVNGADTAAAFRTFFTATRDLGSISLVVGPLVTARVGDELQGTVLTAEELRDADETYPPREAATIVSRIRERDTEQDRDLSEWMRQARSDADLPPDIPAPRDDEPWGDDERPR